MHHCCCCGNGLYTYCTKKAAHGVCKAKEEKSVFTVTAGKAEIL